MVEERILTIAEMAEAFGVSHRCLRFYEQKGLMRPQRRGSARFYGAADGVRLALILKGKRLGFSLEEISRLILARETPARDGQGRDAVALLSPPQIEARLAAFQVERGRIDEAIDELKRALGQRPSQRELTRV